MPARPDREEQAVSREVAWSGLPKPELWAMRAVDLSSHNLDDGKDGREEKDNVLLRSGLDLDWVRRVGRAATSLKHIRPAGTKHVASRDVAAEVAVGGHSRYC